MTDVKWLEITKQEFIIVLQTLMAVYKLKRFYDLDSDTKVYHEDTGEEMATRERIFLYRQYPWVGEANRFFLNEAVVEC